MSNRECGRVVSLAECGWYMNTEIFSFLMIVLGMVCVVQTTRKQVSARQNFKEFRGFLLRKPT